MMTCSPTTSIHADTSALQSSPAFSIRELLVKTDRTLICTALAILVLVPFSVLMLFLDPRVLDGAQVWLKPLKFQISLVFFLLTLAICMPLAGEGFSKGWIGRAVVWIAVATGVFEIVWITFQAGRGERSHYNQDSAFGAGMYAAMGVAALLLSLMPVVVALASFWNRRKDAGYRLMRLSMALGVVVTFAGAAWVGFMLGGSPDHYPDLAEPDHRLPLVGWSTTGGDLRIAHFVGLHAYQGLLILGLLVRALPLNWARSLIWAAAMGWSAMVLVLIYLAQMDVSPFSWWPGA